MVAVTKPTVGTLPRLSAEPTLLPGRKTALGIDFPWLLVVVEAAFPERMASFVNALLLAIRRIRRKGAMT